MKHLVISPFLPTTTGLRIVTALLSTAIMRESTILIILLGEPHDSDVVMNTVWLAGARVEHAQIIVNLGDRRHGGADCWSSSSGLW